MLKDVNDLCKYIFAFIQLFVILRILSYVECTSKDIELHPRRTERLC